MRIVTFIANRPGTDSTKPRVGALLGSEYVFDFHSAISRHVDINGERLEYPSTYMSWFDMDGGLFQQAKELYEELAAGEQNLGGASMENGLIPRSQARLLAPVPRPGKLICIGLNYRDHAAESNMKIPEQPVVFSKFTTSVIAPGEPVVLPTSSHQVDYEAELAVVIGRRAKGVKAREALD